MISHLSQSYLFCRSAWVGHMCLIFSCIIFYSGSILEVNMQFIIILLLGTIYESIILICCLMLHYRIIVDTGTKIFLIR